MGALVGLVAGIGLLLVWDALAAPARDRPRSPRLRRRVAETLAQAGLAGVTPGGLAAASAAVAVVVFLLVAGLSRSPVIGAAFAVIAGSAPTVLVRARLHRHRAVLRDLWPDVVDNIASAVRAGMPLPEALGQLGDRGPTELRPPFRAFAEDYRATGRFDECLDRLKHRLAHPVADRIVETLRLARDVGGTDLGRVLRTLSAFLRDDGRTRAEIETRQGWTINAARLAVAAPWVLLGLLALRPEAVRAYNSAAGLVVLAGGGVTCMLAYRLMVWLGRLPEEERVLR